MEEETRELWHQKEEWGQGGGRIQNHHLCPGMKLSLESVTVPNVLVEGNSLSVFNLF